MKEYAAPGPLPIIFTDLDGTLLSEETYAPGPARPLLERCRLAGIPVIFCSSKTAAEIIALKKDLHNTDPFIAENGGAIYIPRESPLTLPETVRDMGNHAVIEIGAPVSALRRALKAATGKTGADVRGMGEMTTEEVCRLTGLKEVQAGMAMKRAYDEPFILTSGNPEYLEEEIRRLGYTMTRGGRFFHILGGSDKGKAVQILSSLYHACFGTIQSLGIGDAENDLPMFKAVDLGFLVKKPSNKWAEVPALPHLTRVDGIGPQGWAQPVSRLLCETGYRESPRLKKV